MDITIVAMVGGTTNPQPGQYTEGDILTITAIPELGYVFDHWNLGDGFLSSDITIYADGGPWIITAFFKEAASNEA